MKATTANAITTDVPLATATAESSGGTSCFRLMMMMMKARHRQHRRQPCSLLRHAVYFCFVFLIDYQQLQVGIDSLCYVVVVIIGYNRKDSFLSELAHEFLTANVELMGHVELLVRMTEMTHQQIPRSRLAPWMNT